MGQLPPPSLNPLSPFSLTLVYKRLLSTTPGKGREPWKQGKGVQK